MSNDQWKKGVRDVQQGKGAPSPSTFKTDQEKKSNDAGREAERRRQQQQQSDAKKPK